MIYARKEFSYRGVAGGEELRDVGKAKTMHDEMIMCVPAQPEMASRRHSSRRDADYDFLPQWCLRLSVLIVVMPEQQH
jgi:hypothetical protein